MRIKKELKLFIEPRADASGLVSVYPDDRGSFLVRRTLKGCLVYQHEVTEQTLGRGAGFATLDAVRLQPEGPWPDWTEGDQTIRPAEFKVKDRKPVSGGPESEALRIMAHFGPFAIAALSDRIVLLSHESGSVLVGLLEEWRPGEVNFEVPSSVLSALTLGPNEFECVTETLYVKAGPLRVVETTQGYQNTKMIEGAAALATVEGGRVEDLPKDLKRALKKHEVRVGKGPEGMIKYSAEIAPGWVFATFREEGAL